MALSAGAVVAQFDGDFKGLNKGLQDAQSKIDGFTGSIQKSGNKIGQIFGNIGNAAIKYGKILSVVGTVAGGFAIKTAADLQSLSTSFETLTGSAEEGRQVFKDLKKMGATTPFEVGDLAKATQTMLSFGISVEDSQKNLKMLGDVSMGNKDKLGGLTLAFSQVQSTGRLMGQDLLQMINQGFNPLTIISEKTGKSMAVLKKEMENGAISAEMVSEAFVIATSEGGLFYRGMDRGAQTLNGTFSTLMDNIKLMAAGLLGLAEDGTIAQGSLLSLVQNGVNLLNTSLGSINWLGVSQNITAFFVNAINSAKQKLEELRWAWEWLKPSFDLVGAVIRNDLIPAFGRFGQLIKDNEGTIKNFANFIGAVLLVAIAGIVNTVAGAIWMFSKLLDIVTATQRALQGLGKGVSDTFGAVGGFLKGKIPGFADGVRNFGGGMAIVGERGPELVNLPKGADVFSNEESKRMTGGQGITIETMNIKSGVDWEVGASYLAQKLRLS
jgi:tape measure domain-containing protein